MNNDNKTKDNRSSFSFTYSAEEQEELRRIRQKYAPPEENKMELLRRLDRSVHQKATAVSLMFGIVGTLLLGIGMCCGLVWQGDWFSPGILIGLAGIGILSAAYPVYNRVIKREREKIAPEVLRLTDELLK